MLFFHFDTMLSPAGPTPTYFTGTFKQSSINSTYFLQLSGNVSYDVICSIEDFHPGRVTYSTSTLFQNLQIGQVEENNQQALVKSCNFAKCVSS